MTKIEFEKALSKAKSFKSLRQLRDASAASRVALIKEKISETLQKTGWEEMTISLSAFKQYTVKTDTNSFGVIDVPTSSNKFSKWSGKKMKYYVNHKEGSRFQKVTIFVK